MAINKIIYHGNTLLDLTADTVTPSDLANGVTAHDKSGERITGTSTKDSDTSDATAVAAEILADKTAYVKGTKITGTMPNNGAIEASLSDLTDYIVPIGFHDGSGTVGIDSVEKAKLIPGNIKEGVEILGIVGAFSGGGATAQSKTITPAATQQVVLPDSGYDYLSQVTVESIPYVESANQYGTTVTIG